MRIRAMVVEDEPPIQRAIVQCIERRSELFLVAAVAINGRQALKMLEDTPVDVVFTDIRMPVMDGMTLAGELRRRYPQISVVMVSGYQDFAYLRGALLAHAVDYLLKPVTPDSMAPVLAELERRFAAQQATRRTDLLEQAVSGLPVEVPVSLAEERYAVLNFCAGPYPLAENTLLPGQVFWREHPLAEAAAPLLGPEEHFACMAGKTLAEMTLLLHCDTAARVEEAATALWCRLREVGTVPVTLGWQRELLPIPALGEAHRQIRKRMHKQTRLFTSQMLGEEAATAAELDARFAADYADRLGELLRTHRPEPLEPVLRQCVQHFVDAQAAQIQLVHFLERQIDGAANLFSPDTANSKLALREAVSGAVDAAGLAKDLRYVFAALLEEGTAAEHEPPLIAGVEDYLNAHYAESITSATLSHQFGFVPSYISKLFRTYRGLSPSEYLTRCRITHARQLLARDPERMVKEVAAQVGFTDPYYFSKIFKKETGCWPSEFVKK